MNKILCLVTFVLMLATAGFADIARPDKSPSKTAKPKNSIETNLHISLRKDAKEARLVIPKSYIKDLRAALDDMDNDDQTTAAVTGGISRTQTIVSGIFLSLALVFGGMWFVRSGKTPTAAGKALVILAVLAGVGSAATYVYANAGPPAEARKITGKLFSPVVHMYKYGYGTVRLETSDDNTGGIELIVPDPDDKAKPSDEE